ncbi:hypothetical protein [Methanobrevibacter ruminantium]|uniref:hypothetical protein n=1 Tax=Methanobrevibacter ruminantium TaxID=83816 RepID=UPI001180C215|nr:hypothetical protein [Methanobrevibacter ruminantium]
MYSSESCPLLSIDINLNKPLLLIDINLNKHLLIDINLNKLLLFIDLKGKEDFLAIDLSNIITSAQLRN